MKQIVKNFRSVQIKKLVTFLKRRSTMTSGAKPKRLNHSRQLKSIMADFFTTFCKAKNSLVSLVYYCQCMQSRDTLTNVK